MKKDLQYDPSIFEVHHSLRCVFTFASKQPLWQSQQGAVIQPAILSVGLLVFFATKITTLKFSQDKWHGKAALNVCSDFDFKVLT